MRKVIALLILVPTFVFSLSLNEVGNAHLGLGIATLTIGTIDSSVGNEGELSKRITEKTFAVGLGGFLVEGAILCAIPSDANSRDVGIRIATSGLVTIAYLGIIHFTKK